MVYDAGGLDDLKRIEIEAVSKRGSFVRVIRLMDQNPTTYLTMTLWFAAFFVQGAQEVRSKPWNDH